MTRITLLKLVRNVLRTLGLRFCKVHVLDNLFDPLTDLADTYDAPECRDHLHMAHLGSLNYFLDGYPVLSWTAEGEIRAEWCTPFHLYDEVGEFEGYDTDWEWMATTQTPYYEKLSRELLDAQFGPDIEF